MKAPEKLYLRKRNKLPLEVVRDKWYETDPQSLYGSIEYTRTDAFIEKTCEWIKRMWSETNDRFNEDFTGMLIDNFKNYLKGE